MKKLKLIDLYAGIGGIRLGFGKKNFDSIFSSEWDKFAQITYEANFGDKPQGDITLISEKDIPEFDILLAGFPCQPFSQAGKKMGFSDIRGTAFFDIMRIANHHNPRVLFLENVKHFKGHDKGRTLKTVLQELENSGYLVKYQVLNAKNFGVPQNRERIYIIAFNKKKVGLNSFNNFDFPNKLNKQVKLGDILESRVDKKYTISDQIWESHQLRKKRNQEKGYGFGYSLFDKNAEYTSTISARYYKDGSEILIKQKNKNPRKLTPREAARLQGFPDYFKIPVSDTQAYKQFGNSVAVPVIKSISKKIINVMG